MDSTPESYIAQPAKMADMRWASRWYYLPEKDVCVCVPPKNGSTSFRQAIRPESDGEVQKFRQLMEAADCGPFAPAVVMQRFPTTVKLLALRHPVDRFGSLWRDKCRRKSARPDGIRAYMLGWSPNQLMDFLEVAPFVDTHWYPQYLNMMPGVELFRHTDLLRRLGVPKKERPQRHVTTQKDDDPEMPVERIIALYYQDWKLWQRIP